MGGNASVMHPDGAGKDKQCTTFKQDLPLQYTMRMVGSSTHESIEQQIFHALMQGG